MGFKGAYFRPEDAGELESITRANLDLSGRRLLEEDIPHMFPDAYGAEGKRRRKGMGATVAFMVLAGIVPVLVFLILFVFYSNVLKGILAGYFH
jgi:type VI protein secretion system component VasF